MSSPQLNLSKKCSLLELQQELNSTLYGIWFGPTPHQMFKHVQHPILFITDIDEDRAFGFAIVKIDETTKIAHLRAHHIPNTLLHEFISNQDVMIISGDITPTLIKIVD